MTGSDDLSANGFSSAILSVFHLSLIICGYVLDLDVSISSLID